MDDIEDVAAQFFDQPLIDEEIWLGMFNSVSTHPGCQCVGVATAWADQGLLAFKDRFRKPSDNLGLH
ncbi:hypothetical protein [Methylovulum miyakonense]|uniref:hypothetical protein n=1 Tax=Methylovulum miyakonense TaxID=645578 RepID=UPI0003609043|nr:hypothetical protein [Methylovulum miyakonense]